MTGHRRSVVSTGTASAKPGAFAILCQFVMILLTWLAAIIVVIIVLALLASCTSIDTKRCSGNRSYQDCGRRWSGLRMKLDLGAFELEWVREKNSTSDHSARELSKAN